MSVSFSFVVPACGVAPYINDMIRSIKAQTVANIEVLIVSEKSTDGTLEALYAAIEGDPRFRVVELECSGSASASRNYGIRHATGDYLIFVDGDDWIEPDSVERFALIAEKFSFPDVILADWIIHFEQDGKSVPGKPERCHYLDENTIYSGPRALAINLSVDFHSGSPLYLCKRSFLLEHNLFQIPGRRIQDDEWTPRVLFSANTLVYPGFAYYHYRKRQQSVTTDSSGKTPDAFAMNLLSLLDFDEKHEIPEPLRKLWFNWMCRIFFIFFAPTCRRRYSKEVRKRSFMIASSDPHRMCQALRIAGWSKRILIPVLLIARLPGMFFFGEFFYSYLYWPLVFHLWGALKHRSKRGR